MFSLGKHHSRGCLEMSALKRSVFLDSQYWPPKIGPAETAILLKSGR